MGFRGVFPEGRRLEVWVCERCDAAPAQPLLLWRFAPPWSHVRPAPHAPRHTSLSPSLDMVALSLDGKLSGEARCRASARTLYGASLLGEVRRAIVARRRALAKRRAASAASASRRWLWFRFLERTTARGDATREDV